METFKKSFCNNISILTIQSLNWLSKFDLEQMNLMTKIICTIYNTQKQKKRSVWSTNSQLQDTHKTELQHKTTFSSHTSLSLQGVSTAGIRVGRQNLQFQRRRGIKMKIREKKKE